jgi:hypothetical protein
VVYFVIPSEARNLSSIDAQEKKERFLASLGMTKWWRGFYRRLQSPRLKFSAIAGRDGEWSESSNHGK